MLPTVINARADMFGGLFGVAGAALWQPELQLSWQAQHFRKVEYRFRGRPSTLQGQVIDK